jgi:hypothetical protein
MNITDDYSPLFFLLFQETLPKSTAFNSRRAHHDLVFRLSLLSNSFWAHPMHILFILPTLLNCQHLQEQLSKMVKRSWKDMKICTNKFSWLANFIKIWSIQKPSIQWRLIPVPRNGIQDKAKITSCQTNLLVLQVNFVIPISFAVSEDTRKFLLVRQNKIDT